MSSRFWRDCWARVWRARDRGREGQRRLGKRHFQLYLEASQTEGTLKVRYAVIIEKAGRRYSCYVPDLPGCVAAGSSVAKVKAALGEVIPFHLEGLRTGGDKVPAPDSISDYVEV